MGKVITVQIALAEEDYNKIIVSKGERTWPEYLLSKANGGKK